MMDDRSQIVVAKIICENGWEFKTVQILPFYQQNVDQVEANGPFLLVLQNKRNLDLLKFYEDK